MKTAPNQITAHNAGWPSQFRFAGGVSWSGVCEFHRWAARAHFMKISALIISTIILAGCGKPHHETVSGDSVPTFSEQEVREFVTPGRTIAEITNRFGVPGAVMTNDGHVVMWFSNPFEQISKPTTSPFAFSASFTNDMIETWEVLRVKMQTIK